MSRIRLQRTEAIVIKRHDYGEADRILTLYTRERGKVAAIAKGVRRIASRMGGHVELFTHAEMLLAKGRNLDVVTQASTVHPLRGLREDIVRTTYAYHVAEMTDRFCQAELPSIRTFELLRDVLVSIANAADPSLVARYFEIRMLGIQGYRPQLFHCANCATPLEPTGNAFDADAGGVICGPCAGDTRDSVPIGEGPFKVLRFLQTRDLQDVERLVLHDATRTDLERILHYAIRHVLERDLKSVDFLERLRDLTTSVSAGLQPAAPGTEFGDAEPLHPAATNHPMSKEDPR